jgi:type I restriction-modification system DNA methylase subunit
MSNNERNFMLKYINSIYGKKNKVFANMTMPKIFKQFFTPQKYSQIMINELDIDAPKKIIDLSMGEASLLLESIKRWPESEYFGNDIDEKCCEKICSEHPKISCFNLDIFKIDTIKYIENSIDKVDLCLGNPPFHLINQTKDIRYILKQYGLEQKYNSEKIPAEVIFVLQCLTILSNNGTLSLILPDGFFVNRYLSCFREFLITNYKIINIIELPNNIFERTEAKTHILTLKKTKITNKKIKLYKHNLLNNLFIEGSDAINRMDYSYYENLKKYSIYKPISSLDILFMRGKVKYLIKNIKAEHILHSTNFSKGNIFANRLRTKNQLLMYSNKIAIAGDIVIARVGSSCIGNIGYIKKGFFVATDCVFILRIDNLELRKEIYDILISEDGQKWIRSNSKGVAAKHITLEDFKKFPYFVKKEQ